MRSNFLLITVFFLIVQLELLSQSKSISIEVADPTSKGLLNGCLGVVGTSDDGFYLLKSKTKGFSLYGVGIGTKGELSIENYNNEFIAVRSLDIKGISLTILNKAKGKSYEFFYQDKNKQIWMFYSDESQGYNRLYRKRLNQEKFDFEEPVLVTKHKIKGNKLDRRSSYNIIQSADESNFAIYSFVGNKESNKSYVYVEVFDNLLNSQWEMNTTVQEYRKSGYVSKAFGIEESRLNKNICLSNEGTLNIVRKVFKEKQEDYIHIVYSFYEKIEKPIMNVLSNSEKYLLEMSLIQDKLGDLKLTGFYSDTNDSKSIDGLFIQNLDPYSINIKDERFISFSSKERLDFIYQDLETLSKKNKKRIEKGEGLEISSNTFIRSIYVNANNSITMSSEYYTTSSRYNNTYLGDGEWRQDGGLKHMYGDLQFINISEDGEINWIRCYDKGQISETRSILGVYEIFEDDVIHFIYNDIINRELKIGKINMNGEITSNSIASLKKKGELQNFWFSPIITTKLRENCYVGFAYRAFKQRLIKIEVK